MKHLRKRESLSLSLSNPKHCPAQYTVCVPRLKKERRDGPVKKRSHPTIVNPSRAYDREEGEERRERERESVEKKRKPSGGRGAVPEFGTVVIVARRSSSKWRARGREKSRPGRPSSVRAPGFSHLPRQEDAGYR